jgi:DNA-binding FadR family transcriptional regulator
MAKRQTVSELVQNYIRDYIINNKLGPGDQLPPEGDIVTALEVSRVAVRESVKILQALGIVEVRHGNGLFVRGLNFNALLEVLSYNLLFAQSSLKELYQVRRLFEVSMLSEVIENIQEEQIHACHTHLQDWEENIANGRPFHEQDRLFHVTLCQAIGNNILVELENIFWIAYRNAVNKAFPDIAQGAYQATLGNHYKILAAVETRNVELAQQLMAEHFEGIRTRIEMKIEERTE